MKTHTHSPATALLKGIAALSLFAIVSEAHSQTRSIARKAMFVALPVALYRASKTNPARKQVRKQVRKLVPVAQRVMKRSLPVIGAAFLVAVAVTAVIAPKALPGLLLTAFIVL